MIGDNPESKQSLQRATKKMTKDNSTTTPISI